MIGTATLGAEARPDQEHTVGRSPLSRYARWQLRDFVKSRAVLLGIVALLMTYPLLVPSIVGVSGTDDAVVRAALRQFHAYWIYFMFGVLVPLGTLVGVRGIVSEDRQHGFHRFLFAKPVNLVRYYAQSFGVQLAGLMGVLGIVAALYALLVAPVSVVALFVPATVFFVLFGGVAFLFSTVTRTEWVWTLAAVAASAYTRFLVDVKHVGWLRPLAVLLPPLGDFGRMMELFMKDHPGAGLAAAVWPLAYGVLAFLGGLWILRRRSLVS